MGFAINNERRIVIKLEGMVNNYRGKVTKVKLGGVG